MNALSKVTEEDKVLFSKIKEASSYNMTLEEYNDLQEYNNSLQDFYFEEYMKRLEEEQDYYDDYMRELLLGEDI